MIKLKNLLNEVVKGDYSDGIWYHGSASGNLRGGKTGLHLGTFKAAKEALEATIGIPVEGEWDGTREYGKTLLCGKETLKKRNIFPTGFNCRVPYKDFYPSHDGMHSFYSDQSIIPLTVKPSIKRYKIICKINNNLCNPYEDFKANGYMAASLKKGNAKNGFYYRNIGEDEGSISLVVPNGSCVKEI